MYEETVLLQPQMMDNKGCLKLGELLSILSNIATHHAYQLGVYSDEMKGRYGWVVSKLKISLDQPIQNQDSLTVMTYPSTGTNVRFPRSYELYHHETRLGAVISDWSMIDLEKRRIVIPKRIGLTFPPQASTPIMSFEEGMVEGPWAFLETRRVRYSEVDVNGHLNNAHYVMWALDALPLHFLEHHWIQKIVIFFKKETMMNQALHLYICDQEAFTTIQGVDDGNDIHFQILFWSREYE